MAALATLEVLEELESFIPLQLEAELLVQNLSF